MAATSEVRSPWPEALTATSGPPSSTGDVDVVVVGAGIAGLLAATLLVDAGRSVLVLERGGVGGYATQRSTAKVTALQGTTLSSVARSRGADVARAYAAAQVAAVAGIGSLVGSLGIDCDAVRATALTHAETPEGLGRAQAELRACEEAGLPVRWLEGADLPFQALGAVALDDQLRVHPGQLADGLAARLGDRVASATVTGVEEDEQGCTVTLASGAQVRAAHVLLATQSPIVDPGLLSNRCKPQQSYCILARTTAPPPPGMYLSADDVTISVRPYRSGEDAVVVGGNGHAVGAQDDPDPWLLLERWARENLGAGEVTHRWATHDLTTTDHVPFVGRLHPGSRRRLVATGFGKWGFTNAWVAARLVTDLVTGQDVGAAWAAAFDATRIRSTVTSELLSVGRTATTHLVVDRLRRRPEPRCTHQGCVLRKDTALGTWDCPCHGSRFDAAGEVLQGPAVAGLDLPQG